MPRTTAAQLVRIARLRQFVGIFARGGDKSSTAQALVELSLEARNSGFQGDALMRARQAAQVLASEDSEESVRALLHLASACLDVGDTDSAILAAQLAETRAADFDEPQRSQFLGCGGLLGGIACSIAGSEARARIWLDHARECFIAASQGDGAALVLTQVGLLDVESGRREGAQICFRFARDFYRASGQPSAAAEVTALAVRAFVDEGWDDVDQWYCDAIDDADRAGETILGAELALERAAMQDVAGTAEEAARRTAGLAIDLDRRARLQLARTTREPAEALRHVEAAFELALDLRDAPALAVAMEIVVIGLVIGRFTEVGWRLVDRFRERLEQARFPRLAEAAETALADLR